MKEWKEGDTCYYWGKSNETTPRKGTINYISKINRDICEIKTKTGSTFYTSLSHIYSLQEIYEMKLKKFHTELEKVKTTEIFYKNAISDLQRYYEKEVNK